MITPQQPGVFGFELIWGFVIERLVQSLSIVKRFDAFEHAQPGRFEIVVDFVVGPLVFEGPEEAFRGSVIVAAARAMRPEWFIKNVRHTYYEIAK